MKLRHGLLALLLLAGQGNQQGTFTADGPVTNAVSGLCRRARTPLRLGNPAGWAPHLDRIVVG